MNCNLNDLAAVIRHSAVEEAARHRSAAAALWFENSGGIAKGQLSGDAAAGKGAEPSYWFLRLRFAAENATCDKKTFCAALAAEGIRVRERYVNPPSYSDWFKNKQVF